MGLGQLVKNAYDSSAAFVKKEHAFVTASVLASAAFAVDALTTGVGVPQSHFLDHQTSPVLTVALGVPLAYSLNKIVRGEWKPYEYLAKKLNLNLPRIKASILPEAIKKDIGTSFFYFLSACSIYGAYNNVYMYYMIKGIIK